MGKITLSNVTCTNNGGDGVRIEGDIDVDINGLVAHGNGGKGLNIVQPRSLMEQIGLPPETDPLLVAEVLRKLQKPGEPDDKHRTIVQSRLGQFLREQSVNMTTIVANLLTIATNPGVQQIIADLSRV